MFNKYGVSDVSLRKIAAELGISHTNLIYHYKTKNDLLDQLHRRILEAAQRENEQLKKEEDLIGGLYQTTLTGFRILYDYRFFMIDLNYIMRSNPELHRFFLEVEAIRAGMYRDLLHQLAAQDLLRSEEYPEEYEQLIRSIRVLSDYWIASAEIYDQLPVPELIARYARLLLSMFYPYLTERGKQRYRHHFGQAPNTAGEVPTPPSKKRD